MVIERLVVEVGEAHHDRPPVEVQAATGFEEPGVPACVEDVGLVVPDDARALDLHARKIKLEEGGV